MQENWKDYYHKGLAAFFTVAMCILFFFGLFRFNELKTYLGLIISILRPFAFGAVIAYLLCPLCNLLERYLIKLLKIEEITEETEKKTQKISPEKCQYFFESGFVLSGDLYFGGYGRGAGCEKCTGFNYSHARLYPESQSVVRGVSC